jgi:regulator of sigma E protease
LGGYVALPQLADMGALEGGSGDEAKHLPLISYTDKVIIAIMGAVFNLLLALLLATVLWKIGRPTTEDQTTTRIGRVLPTLTVNDQKVPSPASQAGMQAGDEIISVNDQPVIDWLQFKQRIVAGTRTDSTGRPLLDIIVRRDEREVPLHLNPLPSGEDGFRHIGVEPGYAILIGQVAPDSPAARAQLRTDDQIVAVDGTPIANDSVLNLAFRETPAPTRLQVLRDGKPVELALAADLPALRRLEGAELTTRFFLLYQPPLQQFRYVTDMTLSTLAGLLLPGGALKFSDLSGFIGIGRGFWDASKSDYPLRFGIWFTILVNINLAILNLLPIPVLDGGHIVFATVAKLRGRPTPVNVLASIQSVFVVLLLSLMIYAAFNDTRRIVRDNRRTEADKSEQTEPAKP